MPLDLVHDILGRIAAQCGSEAKLCSLADVLACVFHVVVCQTSRG